LAAFRWPRSGCGPGDLWLLLLLVPAAPFGLLLGMGQTILLRPRDPDALAAAVGLGMLALPVFALWVGT